MKQSTLYAVIAFLLGVSIFGFYKSLVLQKKNTHLELSVLSLRREAVENKKLLLDTKSLLQEEVRSRDLLGGRFRELQIKLENKAGELKKQLARIEAITSEFSKIVASHEALEKENNEISQRFVRLNLENKELRRELTSSKSVRQRLHSLESGGRQSKKRVEKKAANLALGLGNQGYLIRNGVTQTERERSTRSGFEMDVKVIPAQRRTEEDRELIQRESDQ